MIVTSSNPGAGSPRILCMNRRAFIKIAAGITVLAGGAAALTRPARAKACYSGPVSDHFDGQKFFLPGGVGPRSIGRRAARPDLVFTGGAGRV